MKKFQAFLAKHKRKVIQLYAALLYNANIKGYISGEIYKGNSKGICVPGLNCYSCPGAVGACPLGSLQNALTNAGKSSMYYILGIIMLFGVILGRTICGWLCPVGLGQELLYKIPSFKVRKSKATKILSYLKYVILAVFVIAIPIIYGLATNYVIPAFCKYICPSGTLEGAILLLSNPNNKGLFPSLGPLFTWKFILLIIIVIASIFIYRFFCRFFCPLGAIYSLFNKFSIIGVTVNEDKCTSCGKCIKECKMDIKNVGGMECIQCGKCISICSTNAITWKMNKNKPMINPNSTINVNKEIKAIDALEEKLIDVSIKSKKKGVITTSIIGGTMILSLVTALVLFNVDFKKKDSLTIYNVGDKVDNFSLALLNKEEGSSFNLENYLGKVVVINFWQTSCASCVKEMNRFEAIYQEYKTNIEVIAIHGTIEDKDPKAYVNQVWGDYEMMFGLDNFASDGITSLTYQAFGGKQTYPLTAILDKEGVMRYKTEASIELSTLKNKVEELL